MHQSTRRPLRSPVRLQTHRITPCRPFQARSHRCNQSRNRQKRITSPRAGDRLLQSKDSYLSDYGGHNAPHMMFYETAKDGTAWGANLTNSPVLAVNYWYISAEAYPQLKSFPPLSVFLVGVAKWSDGNRHRACKDPAAKVKSRRAKNRNLERVHPWNPFIGQGCAVGIGWPPPGGMRCFAMG